MRSQAIVLSLALGAVACSSSTAPATGGSHDGGAHDSAAPADTGAGHDAGKDTATPGTDALPPPKNDAGDAGQPTQDAGGSVSFEYTPDWTGATAVSVVGGFGQSTDWTKPFLALTSSGSGSFTGTATLPDGMYLYVFLVTGDPAAGDAGAKYTRYVVDPTNPAYGPCPAASPTYDKNNPNPCSQLSVPQPAAAPLYDITGTVVYDSTPTAGYLVLLERDETGSHHFPANRTTSASDGTFKVQMAKGQYRLQVQYPTFISETDAERDPLALLAVRRSISSPHPIGASMAFPSVDVAYHDYDKMTPTDGGEPLPTTLHYTVIAGATGAYAAVYGPGANIGDPWFDQKASTATTEVFDGGFNTAQATQTKVAAGTSYSWGTWQVGPASDAGVTWSGESMVFPIGFQ